MSQKFVYKLILITCLLATQVGMAAGKISNVAIRRYRGMRLLDGLLYFDQIVAGSGCDLLLTAAQNELGRELEPSEIQAEIFQLRKQFADSFKITSGPIGSKDLYESRSLGWRTLVLTPEGGKTIAYLSAGDNILTFDQSQARMVPSKVLVNVAVRDVLHNEMRLANGKSLVVGDGVMVGTGTRENVRALSFRFTLFKLLFLARCGNSGGIQFETQRSWKLPKYKTGQNEKRFLVTQNGLPFFANGLLVFSLNHKDQYK